MCQQCGNERLRHLHKVKLATCDVIEVGCVCAAKLCGQEWQQRINDAERAMDRQDGNLKKLAALKSSWKVPKMKGKGKKVTGEYDGIPVVIYWSLGSGYTTDHFTGAPVCPEPRGYETIMQWVEKMYGRLLNV